MEFKLWRAVVIGVMALFIISLFATDLCAFPAVE